MKRAIVISLAACLPLVAQAQYTGPAAQPAVMTVAEAQKAGKDAKVVLEGNVIRKLDNERYEFRDATGVVNVEIDRKRLPAKAFDQSSKVRITGEVESRKGTIEIDVKKVEVLG